MLDNVESIYGVTHQIKKNTLMNHHQPYKIRKKTIKYFRVGSIEIRQKYSKILNETYLKSGNKILLSAKIYIFKIKELPFYLAIKTFTYLIWVRKV